MLHKNDKIFCPGSRKEWLGTCPG